MSASNAIVSDRRVTVPSVEAPVFDYTAYTPLDSDAIEQKARLFAHKIESHFDEIAEILLSYESYEVVQDETARTLDILRSLHENKKYFKLRVNEVAAFLPRNQPLYAFTCFVLIPALMAHKVFFRIPQSMRSFFSKLLELLDIEKEFPNVVVSHKGRLDFLSERSALRVNAEGDTIPVTDAVIFTGTSIHAEQLRAIFDNRTMFISNGSGHNPIVISKDANLDDALNAILTLQLYNQGQDCAAPNAILVHTSVHSRVLEELRKRLSQVGVGEYRNRANRVGPISDPKDLVRIEDFLTDNLQWIDPKTPGTIITHRSILHPTIINKPLTEGGNYNEIFAPVIYLQKYREDSALALYFENPRYAANAMYVTVYGSSNYIEDLIDRPVNGKVLHKPETVLRNTHLHSLGIERGTQPYGGYGTGASSLSIHSKVISKPTLPQRDIYEHIVRPLLKGNAAQKARDFLHEFKQIKQKNIPKILKLLSAGSSENTSAYSTDATYIDIRSTKRPKGRRYIRLDEKHTYHLLDKPNAEHIAQLNPKDIVLLRKLQTLLKRRKNRTLDDFKTLLYALPRNKQASERINRAAQLRFFQHVYQLLFAKDHGPRLAQFLQETELEYVLPLLDV